MPAKKAIQAQLDNAKTELDRAAKLLAGGVVARTRVDLLQTQFDVLTNQLTAAEADRDAAAKASAAATLASAKAADAASLASSDREYSVTPTASPSLKASACSDSITSAAAARAMEIRVSSGTK